MAAMLLFCFAPTQITSAQGEQLSPTSKKIFAQRHFERGQSAYRAGDYQTALDAFTVSLELAQSPNTMLFVARSRRQLGRNAEAANGYENTIRAAKLAEERDPRYAKTAKVAASELHELRKKVAGIRIASARTESIRRASVNGHVVPQEGLDLLFYVDPGEVDLEIFYADGSVEKQAIAAVAGQEHIVMPHTGDVFIAPTRTTNAPLGAGAPQSLNDSDSAADTVGWVGLGVGAGLAVVGFSSALGFSLASNAKYAELEKACGGPCSPPRPDDIEEGETYDSLSTVGLIVGIVGTGVALASAVGLSLREPNPDQVQRASLSFDGTGITYRW